MPKNKRFTISLSLCVCVCLCGLAHAEEISKNQNADLNLTNEKSDEFKPIIVTAKKPDPTEVYVNTMTRDQIQKSASGNGDIGSMLRALPNIQFDEAQRSSLTPGEIDPAKISISGGQHYQNKFTLDGMNINTDLDPANESAGYQGRPPGRSQGMNVNVDLLDSIRVYDSNIGAEYGGFNGGVIEAKTKRPEKGLGFSVSHQYTNGNVDKNFPKSFTKYKLYGAEDSDIDTFRNSWSKSNQPEFEKHITKISAESIINDQWGFIGQFNRTYSKIPLRLYEDYHKTTYGGYNETEDSPLDPKQMDKIKQNQKRYSYNAFVKAYYDPNPDLNFEFSYAYMPDYSREYLASAKGFFYDVKHGGHQAGINTTWNNTLGELTNIFSFSKLSDEIVAHGYRDWKYWVSSENHNWGTKSGWAVVDGGYPASISSQTTFADKIKQEFKPFNTGNLTHNVKVGAEIELIKADFKYKEEHYLGNSWTKPMTAAQRQACIDGGDYSWCDPSPAYESFYGEGGHPSFSINGDTIVEYLWTDQYGNQRHSRKWPYGQYRDSMWFYKGDKIKVSDNKIGVFLEDNIQIPLGTYGKLHFRPGIRADYTSYMKNFDIAPRFSLDYALPWNETNPEFATHVTTGWNRYYGRNMYAYGLDDGVYRLRTDIRRSGPDKKPEDILAQGKECQGRNDTDCIVKYQSETRFTELDMPYVDEWMIGFSQDFLGLNLTTKYIHRDGKREVVRTTSDKLGLPELDGYDPSGYYIYTNDGTSKTNIISFILETTEPFEFLGVSNTFKLGFDWTNVKRNTGSYVSNLSTSQLDNEYILWGGTPTRWSERPASNFVKPYSIKLSTFHDWKMLGGNWHFNNLFAFKQGYKSYVRKQEQLPNGRWTYSTVAGSDYGINQPTLDVYEVKNLPNTFTWDLRLGAEYKIYGENKLFFNIDIYNVLNKGNVALASLAARSDDLTPTYEVGRQFWFEIGYRY